VLAFAYGLEIRQHMRYPGRLMKDRLFQVKNVDFWSEIPLGLVLRENESKLEGSVE
jgi:hypothetical protein